MRPYAYQQKVLDQINEEPSVLLAADLGTGKTPMATWGVGDMERVLIIGPVRTFDGWERTVNTIYGKHVRPIGKTRKAEKANWEAVCNGEPGWFFVGWEMMRSLNTEKRWDGRARKEINKAVPHPFNGTVFDAVIADEWHRACNWRSQNYQVVSRIKADRKFALSATPAGNLSVNIWAAYAWLWPDKCPPTPGSRTSSSSPRSTRSPPTAGGFTAANTAPAPSAPSCPRISPCRVRTPTRTCRMSTSSVSTVG